MSGRAHFLKAALAIHSPTDANAKLGETLIAAKNRIYPWRAAEGPFTAIITEDKDAREQLQRDLGQHSLFDRLNLTAILPIDREVPLLCLKMQIVQTPGQPAAYECKLNNQPWSEGLTTLTNFHLPTSEHPILVTQYAFFRRAAKSRPPPQPAAAATKAASKVSVPAAVPAKRPWWKVW